MAITSTWVFVVPEPEWTIGTLRVLMDERFEALEHARVIQAREYERRLADLNHAHEKAVEVQHTYVTQDKYEDKLAAEAEARGTALLRVDERFHDYVKRYEARQREVDLALAAQKGAAEQVQRASEELSRRANRNIAIATLALAVLVAVSNYLSSL
jgi:hypothetical protein